MKLSIIIPAHNEEQRLPPVLEAYAAYFAAKYENDFELIIVPNFCSDRTSEVAQAIGKFYPQVRVLDDPGRVGKGGAVLLGAKSATGGLIGFVDADGATPPAAFETLVGAMDGAGCVIASRWLKDSIMNPRQPIARRVMSRCFNFFVRVLFGLKIIDTQCGAKVFRHDVIHVILPRLGLTNWAFDVDMLFQVKRAGYSIREMPTVWNDQAGSKIRYVRSSLDMVMALVRLRLLYSPFRQVVEIYNGFSRLMETMGGRVKLFLHGLISDEMLRHTGILFSGMMVVHVCNLVYQMAVSRVLPNEEYVLLTAFLGVLAIIARPLTTLTTGVSHYSSLLHRAGRTGDVKRLLLKWLWLTGVPAIALGALFVIFNRPLAGFLHLDRGAPVIIAGAVLPALFWLPILNGAGQGLQLFGWIAAATTLGAVVRLGLGAGLVWFVYPGCGWAMLGHGLGIYASAVLLLLGLILMLRGKGRSKAALPSMRFYLIQSFFIQAAYAVLMTADVILVKHYLPDDTEFAYAATLGRIVVFLSGAIVMAMFPKVASEGGTTEHQRVIYSRSMLYTFVFVMAAVIGCAVFPGLLARILFGITDASVYLKRMIGLMAVVMGFSTLLNVVLQFLLAQRRFRPAALVVLFAVLYLVGAAWFHATSWQIIAVAGMCNAGALLTLFFLRKSDLKMEAIA